jgi:hypothetical protein
VEEMGTDVKDFGYRYGHDKELKGIPDTPGAPETTSDTSVVLTFSPTEMVSLSFKITKTNK